MRPPLTEPTSALSLVQRRVNKLTSVLDVAKATTSHRDIDNLLPLILDEAAFRSAGRIGPSPVDREIELDDGARWCALLMANVPRLVFRHIFKVQSAELGIEFLKCRSPVFSTASPV